MERPEHGNRIGKYELLTPLTSGGMAELFLGMMLGPGGFQKYVVIKRILPNASRDEAFLGMFLDEARITAGFAHPNIAQVYDLGEDEQGLYVAMEFISGQNLNQVISRCAKEQHVLPLGFSVSVVNDCALALHYAHTYVKPSGEPYPVVHRDVAQKNIMVGWDGQSKLLDFGIAKAGEMVSRTKAGMVKGTAGYMSPEQVMAKHVDGRSDVFSLGVVAWEMVTGERLFSADTEVAEMKLILNGKVERPDEVEPVVPSELSDVIMRALAREPADRWPTARDFSKALMTRCPDLMFDVEQRSLFMREMFADRIEQSRKLFELAKPNRAASATEVRELAKAIQESAMSQPVLKTVKGLKKPSKKKKQQHSVEDDMLLELAIRADQLSSRNTVHAPKRTWGGAFIVGVLVVLVLAITNRIFFKEKRVSSNGLVLWDGETETIPIPVVPGAVPGSNLKERVPDDPARADSPPLALQPRVRQKASPTASSTGEVFLALLPEGGKVFKGTEQLAEGAAVSFKLPSGTHLLTIVGKDGIKRGLSVQTSPSQKVSLKLHVPELPTQ
jgi:eukaryotic-like serine/threonine-protein kinase